MLDSGKKMLAYKKIGPAKHVENGVVAAVILRRIRLHPLANRPNLLSFFSGPRLVHCLSVLLPGRIMRERFEHARHRHAREKMRSLIKSRCILSEGRSAQQQQRR